MKENNIHKVFSSPMRVEIIRFLGTGKKYLSEIAQHINKTPQTVDFHLNILENSGITNSIEEDSKKYYVLRDKNILRFIDSKEPIPHKHNPKPPHEIVLDFKKEVDERLKKIEDKLDLILKKM